MKQEISWETAIECDPEDALLSYTHSGNTVRYFVKNGTPVTLRYTASALTDGPFSNTVEVNGQSVTKTGTAEITSRGTTGARETKIKILKHSGTNLKEGIQGVQFELYEYDASFPDKYDPSKKVLQGTYSTDEHGMFTIEHIPLAVEGGAYTNHSVKYVLHEVEPPEGYKALPHDYNFTVDTQTATYGQYIYLQDDTLPISNEPIKEDELTITVKKLWPDGAANLPDTIRVRLYRKDSRTSPSSSAEEVDVVDMVRGADGTWTHTFTGLNPDKAYFVKEDPIDGYTTIHSDSKGAVRSQSPIMRRKPRVLLFRRNGKTERPKSPISVKRRICPQPFSLSDIGRCRIRQIFISAMSMEIHGQISEIIRFRAEPE